MQDQLFTPLESFNDLNDLNVAKYVDTPELKTKNTHDFKIDGVLNEQLAVLSDEHKSSTIFLLAIERLFSFAFHFVCVVKRATQSIYK